MFPGRDGADYLTQKITSCSRGDPWIMEPRSKRERADYRRVNLHRLARDSSREGKGMTGGRYASTKQMSRACIMVDHAKFVLPPHVPVLHSS